MRIGPSISITGDLGVGVPPVPAIPVNSALPVVSGDEYIGETLSCSTGTWTGFPAPTFTYQWQAATVNISGATSSTYVLTSDEDGDTITCEVTATNSEGSAMAESVATGAISEYPWDILLIAGQSNGSGRGTPLDALGLDAPDDQIKQWETEIGQTGALQDAVEYLTAADGGGTGISFALTLAKQYLANRTVGARKVVMVNVCSGGSSLSSGSPPEWSPTGTIYSNAFTRISEVAAAMPAGSAFRGIWWSQGESDVSDGSTTAEYIVDIGDLIDDFRASAVGNVPFVSLGMVPSWSGAGRSVIDEALENIPAIRENCAYVVGDDTGAIDDIHYSAVQQRANGLTLYTGLATAEANTSANVGAPTTPTITSATNPVAGEIVVTYAVTGPLEKFEVQYKLRASGTWTSDLTVYGDTVPGTHTINSLATGDYDVRILSTNFAGSTASATTAVDGVVSGGLAYMPMVEFGSASSYGRSSTVTGFTTTPNTREVRWRIEYDSWLDGAIDKAHWGTNPTTAADWYVYQLGTASKWYTYTVVNGVGARDDAGSGWATMSGIMTYRVVYDFTGGTGPVISFFETVDNVTPLQDILVEAGGWVEIGSSTNFGQSTQTMTAHTGLAVGSKRYTDDANTDDGKFYEAAWYEDGTLVAEFIPVVGTTGWTASTGETWVTDETVLQA